jgi:hypothetical protein
MSLYLHLEKLQTKRSKVSFLSFMYVVIIFFLMAGGIFCLLDIEAAVRYVVIGLVVTVITYILAKTWRR